MDENAEAKVCQDVVLKALSESTLDMGVHKNLSIEQEEFIFDMCWLSDQVDTDKLSACMEILVFNDPGMRENSMRDVRSRVRSTFASERYIIRLSGSRKNWLDMEVPAVLDKLAVFLDSL